MPICNICFFGTAPTSSTSRRCTWCACAWGHMAQVASFVVPPGCLVMDVLRYGSGRSCMARVAAAFGIGVVASIPSNTVWPGAFVLHPCPRSMTLTTRRCKSEEEMSKEAIKAMVRGLQKASNEYFERPAENYEDVMLKMMQQPDSGVRQWADEQSQKIRSYLDSPMRAEANDRGGTKSILGRLSRRARQLKQRFQKWLSKMSV